LRRSLTELAEEEGETRAQPLLVLRADTRCDFTGELLAEQAPAVERIPDRGANRLPLVTADFGVEDAGRVSPGGQLTRRACDSPPGRTPQRQLNGRVQMERSAQRPGLHEQPAFPEGLPYAGLGDPVHTEGELKLCGRLHLGVHAAEVVCDIDEPSGGRPRRER